MFVARILFFRLHESPRYLVHAGRPQEALQSLQLISRFNGSELSIHLDDVRDDMATSAMSDVEPPATSQFHTSRLGAMGTSMQQNNSSTVIFDADAAPPSEVSAPEYSATANLDIERASLSSQRSHDVLRGSPESEVKSYSAVGESNTVLEGHSFTTPTIPHASRRVSFLSTAPVPADILEQKEEPSTSADMDVPRTSRLLPPESPPAPRPRSHMRGTSSRRMSTTSSMYEVRSKLYWKLPRWLRRPLCKWLDRIAMVLSPEWFKTTVLMWATWCAMSLGLSTFAISSWCSC